MKTYDSANIRNVVLLGQGGSGKTLLAESMLFKTGATTRRGVPGEGTSTIDASPEEIKRKMSLNLGFAPIEWNGHKINVLDAPGFADFVGDAEAALFAADMAIIVINGGSGVEPDTERFYDMVVRAEKPAVFLVNQMDKDQADYQAAVSSIRDRLSNRAVAFFLPIGAAGDYKGLVDVVAGKAFVDVGKGDTKEADVPADLQDQFTEIRSALAEAAAESDDALLEKYLEEGELSADEISRGLLEGVRSGTAYPILAGSAETQVGLDRLLSFIVEWGPSPLDAPQPKALREGQEDATPLEGRIDGPPVAYVFKTYFDERLGEYSVLRAYSGKLTPGDYYNPRKQSAIRLGAMYSLRGKERIDLEGLVCGDIAATPRIKNTATGDTISSKDQRVVIEPHRISEPLHTVAVVATGRGDGEKVAAGFYRLQEFDPTFRVTVDSALRQTLISGMGDQHLDVQIERLKNRNKVEVETTRPRIAYRETIQGRIDDIQGKYKKQTGGRGQYGDVHLKLEPMTRGGGLEFVNAIVGGVIPTKFIPAVEKGVRETTGRGVLVGYPVVDVKTTLHFGSYHDVDSSENAFKMAGTMAFKEGFMRCTPILLEPIMKLQIIVPEEYTGDIMGDMSSRRGRIQGMEQHGKRQIVRAEAPEGELFGYVASLRSMTQGRGNFTVELSHYAEVPREVLGKLVETLKQEMEAAKS